MIRLGASPPLGSLPPRPELDAPREIPLRAIPGAPSQGQTDPVVQSTATLPVQGSGQSIEGLGKGFAGMQGFHLPLPPDPNGAVGATQYVQMVNVWFAVFDKQTGGVLRGPDSINTLFTGFTGTLCSSVNGGDPIVAYDKLAGRWNLMQLAYQRDEFGDLVPPYYLCIAISQTSDALGAYNLYALEWLNDTFPDYPKWGVWPTAYFASFNMFSGFFGFLGGQICALERSRMLVNQDASVQCQLFTFGFPSSLPADQDGSLPPPPGSPGYFMNLGSNALNLVKFKVDWANPNNTTITSSSITVAKFNQGCDRACIPQPGTTQQLDALGDRLMHRLAYRNLGTHESLVATHSVAPSSGGGGPRPRGPDPSKPGGGGGGSTGTTGVTGVRWYEIRNPNGTPKVYQQGTYAPADGNSRWMGSIAMDKVGNILVGYSVSSGTLFPSIRLTGRDTADPLGTLQAELSVKEGTGSQTTFSRWGDYSSMVVDPVDDCTLWYTTEYLAETGARNWHTRIAKFKFSSCQ